MTNGVDMSDLAQLAQSLLDAETRGQEYMLSQVHSMTRQAYERYPEDPVIRQFAFVIEQMAEKKGAASLISQTDMTRIYNDLVRLSSNTRFRSVLGELILDTKTISKNAGAENFINTNRENSSSVDVSDFIDQSLIKNLHGAFGGSIDEEKSYNEKMADKGAQYVALELESMGFKPRVNVLDGAHDTIIYGAQFDTKDGLVTVAIPLDVSAKKILLPSIFVADSCFEELKADRLSAFIEKKSVNRNFSVPDTKAILKAIGIATGKIRTASDEELKAAFGDQVPVSKQVVAEPAPHVDTLPVFERAPDMPKELAHLAQDFETEVLESASSFGKDAVSAGRNVVIAELAAAGFRHSQVRFISDGTDSVYYAASLNTPKGVIEIEVPIEMKMVASNQYKPLLPTYFAYDGVVEGFAADKLQRFAINLPSASSGQRICSTAHSYMTLPELKDEILKSAAENDYVGCEMALNVISERFGEEHYKNAVEDYYYLLTVKNNAVNGRKCSRPIAPGKGSIESRCSHLLVPMSRVVVGDDGVCRLRSTIERERLNPVVESSANISTSKINLT